MHTATPYTAGTPVISRDGKTRGNLTYPCTKGMTWQGNTWRRIP